MSSTSTGVRRLGYDFLERVKDGRSDGSLDRVKAAQNRAVRVSVVDD